MTYLRAAAAASRHIELGSFGYTTEGRPLPVVFVNNEGSGHAPWESGTPKPVILINAGIHSGEICGQDAILMLLRDLARGVAPEIVSHLRLILVPTFNIDGHERKSPYNRFTQNGPADGFGTRRNALRLDLNRDFAKLETPECQSLVRLASQFQPHIFVDLHTNDGFSHEYDLLFGAGVDPTLPGSRAAFVREGLVPQIVGAMLGDGYHGHLIGYPLDRFDISAGLATYGIHARLSTGYFETRHTISILSEAHAYISYKRRVRATLSLIRAILDFAVKHRIQLCEVVDGARRQAVRWTREPGVHEIALGCTADRETPRQIRWHGKALEEITSPVTRRSYARYLDEKLARQVPFCDRLKPARTATMPRGYLMDRAWGKVAETLRRHSIDVKMLTEPFDADVELFRFASVAFAQMPYQGHHPITALEGDFTADRRIFPAGTYWVPLDQPAGITAMHLLEPRSPDALLVWNAFDTIFERGIVLENWALEENALHLLADSTIRAEYEAALEDSAFAADPDARLEFFFQKTPFVEKGEKLYPVYRVMGPAPQKFGPS